MLYLLKKSMYSQEDHRSDWAGHTKHFQHIEFDRIAAKYPSSGNVGEVGAKTWFKCLDSFVDARRFVIDPYDGAPGGGLSDIPKLPFPVGLFRCYIGYGESVIPDRFFDLTFSISVIEHIGQAETGFDRQPVKVPPPEQEIPRDKFCEDLFRITAPGGVTIHSVDHAARNRTYVDNFLRAGFELISEQDVPSEDECMNDRENIVQLTKWGRKSDQPSDLTDWELDAVMIMGFRRPINS
tara:strand:- start:144 stop:857 length:714 start_codon:yes stop_codon:yes gene_type:complete